MHPGQSRSQISFREDRDTHARYPSLENLHDAAAPTGLSPNQYSEIESAPGLVVDRGGDEAESTSPPGRDQALGTFSVSRITSSMPLSATIRKVRIMSAASCSAALSSSPDEALLFRRLAPIGLLRLSKFRFREYQRSGEGLERRRLNDEADSAALPAQAHQYGLLREGVRETIVMSAMRNNWQDSRTGASDLAVSS
jgi:hypothetical protein